MGAESNRAQAKAGEQRCARLKTVVEHVGHQWTAVLYRQAYFHEMTRDVELGEALDDTYAAHVHNAIADTFVVDLIREAVALVLDRDSKSASVAVAVKILRDHSVLEELRKDYRTVLPSQWLGPDDVPLEVRKVIEEAETERQIAENLVTFDERLTKVMEIQGSVFDNEIGELLRVARNKSVAHYDVVREGGDWKLWRIEGTGLTYGKLDEYVDACTAAVDRLLHLVERVDRDFSGVRQVAQEYAADYIGALVIGLRRKKEVREARLGRGGRE